MTIAESPYAKGLIVLDRLLSVCRAPYAVVIVPEQFNQYQLVRKQFSLQSNIPLRIYTSAEKESDDLLEATNLDLLRLFPSGIVVANTGDELQSLSKLIRISGRSLPDSPFFSAKIIFICDQYSELAVNAKLHSEAKRILKQHIKNKNPDVFLACEVFQPNFFLRQLSKS